MSAQPCLSATSRAVRQLFSMYQAGKTGWHVSKKGLAWGLLSASAVAFAGPGKVCLDGISPADTCGVGTINTYYANSPKLRKFIDTLPGLTSGNANKFLNGKTGEYIPLAVADTNAYPGSNYYVIGVVEHEQWMHSDLAKPTTQRSYVQLYPQGSTPPQGAVALKYPSGLPITWPGTNGEQVYAYDQPHYLGPIIVATAGTPVRVKAVNFLPTGRADLDSNGKVVSRNGDMFLPVDESLPGAGVAPLNDGDKYPQNRVAFHLHGGDSPWISDGTPHQWVTAAGDTSPYKVGDRLANVPDMPHPGDGGQTIFWPNDQTSRLMWYHDHTFGLTRQNAYSGAAAGYVIVDSAELALLSGGTVTGANGSATVQKSLPGALLEQVVLVIQDKTFVPNDIGVQDAKWDTKAWGKPGDLWYPHVYEPFELWNLADGSFQSNPAGRWDYAVNDLTGEYLPPRVSLHTDGDYGDVAFPDGSYGNASATPESYMDTPVVNGVAYPTMEVDPKAYRFRFLNGANDRYWNLSMWVADDTVQSSDGRTKTEVKMVPADGAEYTLADGKTKVNVPNDQRPGGVPHPAYAGPSVVQFGNEAGLLPAPVIHTPQPMQLDASWAEIKGDFYLGGAERADTVIDFSKYAGKTLIVYNDSTAPVPGGDNRYDYYTDGPDLTTSGGAPSTPAGFGPNTRTVMQIVVRTAVTTPIDYVPTATGEFDVGKLATNLAAAYRVTADPHIVADLASVTKVDTTANKITIGGQDYDLKPKIIMGFTDPNVGRLIAQLGVELPNALANEPTPLAYVDTPTDIVEEGKTQYWIIKNIDADNHPMHFHLFNVQVLGRIDPLNPGSLIAPEPDEAGWKETVKNWPGQDVIVALKPKTPALPFGLPNSRRLMDPTLPANATSNDALKLLSPGNTPVAFTQIDLATGQPAATMVKNDYKDFGWEYVWHCHILGHEENDLMRPMVFLPNITAPSAPTNVSFDSVKNKLVWTDATPAQSAATKGNSSNEIGFRVERKDLSKANTGFVALGAGQLLVDARVNTLANATEFQDSPAANTDYMYRVIAVNEAGEATSSEFTLQQAPLPPSAVDVSSTGLVTWTTTSTNQSGFRIERAMVNGAVPGTFAPIATVAGTDTSYQDSTYSSANVDYAYRVIALNGTKETTASAAANFLFQAPTPASGLAVAVGTTARALSLNWLDNSGNESGFSLETSTDNGATWIATQLAANVKTQTLAVAPATAYSFRVSATKPGFANVYSNTASTTTPAELLAPVAFTATSTYNGASSQVVLTWNDASTGETAYVLERCAGSATACAGTTANWVLISSTLPASNVVSAPMSYTDTTLAGGTSYVYRVKAVAGTTVGPVATSAAVTSAVNVAAPTSLSAASPSGSGVTLTWVDASTNETAFQVERAPAGSTAFAVVGTVARTATLTTATGGAVTYVDATAAAGSSYVYQVRAINTTGTTVSTSAPSAPVSITLSLPAPTSLSAVQSAGNVALSWIDTSATETAFEVLRTDTSNGTTTTFTVTRTAAQTTAVNGSVTYNDVAAAVGVVYSYQVRAVSAPAGAVAAYSVYSNAVSASVILPAPTQLTTALPATGTGVILYWVDNATFETGYRIDRAVATLDASGNVVSTGAFATVTTLARTGTASTTTGAVSYTDTAAAALPAGQAYAYQVYAVKGTSFSAPSNVASSAGAAAVNNVPSALSANTSTGVSVVLNWIDNSTTETSFLVTRTDAAGVVATFTVTRTATQAKSTGTPVSYTDTTAVVGVVYSYTVAAVTPTGNFVSPSVSASLTLAAPTNASVGAGVTGITVGWTDMSNNETGFQLVRNVIDPVTNLPMAGSTPLTIAVTSSATQKTAVGVTRTYLDTTAVPGVLYSYTVATVGGTTAAPVLSAAVSTTPVAVKESIVAPSTPSAVVSSKSRITVTWTDLSTNETGFLVERSINGAAFAAVATVARTGTATTGVNGAVSYADNLVAPITLGTYQYRVTAVNQTGAVTNAASAQVLSNLVDFTAPVAPTALTATTTAGVAGVVNLSWLDNSGNETGFTVQRATNATFTAGLVTTSVPGANAGTTVNYALNGLTSASKVFFRVQASNLVGASAYVTTTTAVTVP